MHRLLSDEHIGFTDVVKRPTAGGADLRASDYKRWAPVLCDKIARYEPPIVWFQGKGAYTNFVRHGLRVRPGTVEWGLQPISTGESRLFVTPNPSAANAAFSLQRITDWMDGLAAFAYARR
jgi:TDG/mug DNA glycosylase family protein